MPGMLVGAPERTDTSSGRSPPPKVVPVARSSSRIASGSALSTSTAIWSPASR
jgi:hypothetical protein